MLNSKHIGVIAAATLAFAGIGAGIAQAGPMTMSMRSGYNGTVELRSTLGEAAAPNCVYRYTEGYKIPAGGTEWRTVVGATTIYMGPEDVVQTDCALVATR